MELQRLFEKRVNGLEFSYKNYAIRIKIEITEQLLFQVKDIAHLLVIVQNNL